MRALLIIVGLSVVVGGCARVEPKDTRVTAEDVQALSEWQRHTAAQFPADLRGELEEAVQEIRFQIMAKGEGTGHDAIEAALCHYVDKHTVKEVLLIGEEIKLQRLEVERSDLLRVIDANAHLVTKPDDSAAANTLERIRTAQQKRLDVANAGIQEVERRIAANGGAVRDHEAGTNSVKTENALPREEALKEMAVMIQERRSASMMKYGGWPVRIDREGLRLSATERQDFIERKAAAEKTGRTVIPIKIKGHWLYYEARDEAPALTGAFLANLTAEDRRKFQENWVNSEAERWAREAAADFPVEQATTESAAGLPAPTAAAPSIRVTP